MPQSEFKHTMHGVPVPEGVAIDGASRSDSTPPPPRTGALVRNVATAVGHPWRAPVVDPGPELEVEAEFISIPGVEPSGSGRASAPVARDESSPRAEIVLVEPAYSSPPLPPWIHVDAVPGGNAPSRDLVMLSSPNGLAAQQFRTLRYRVEQEPDAQIVAVVSPRPGEGRSVTAANLALALAEGGRVRVLLIDASLRSPAQAKLFGLTDDAGLTSTLAARQRDPLAPLPLAQIRRGLYVLAAGPRVSSPHAALASEAAAHLIGSLRRTFRYILVDSSAIFGSAETLAWHGMIDRYLMLARRGRTTTDDLGRAAARIGRDKILGVSFIGASRRMIAS